MILVTGATGNAGSEVVRALVRSGARVRAFVRDPEKAHGLLGSGVELAVGDFADAASVAAALEGVEAVALSCADDPRRVAWETAAIDAAGAAGVRLIVKLSTIGAEPGAPVSFWDWHGQVERRLRGAGIPYAVLRSSFYMSNLLASAEQIAHGLLAAPAGEARIAMIDPRDVGAAAAAVLTGSGHDGRTYVLTGPEPVTYRQVAATLTAATGRAVEFVDVPPDAALHGMVDSGLPHVVAEQVVKVFEMLRRGIAEPVTSTVEELTGGPPGTMAGFVRRHLRLFEPRPVASGA